VERFPDAQAALVPCEYCWRITNSTYAPQH
jgi:hypothetical protein